MERPVGPEPTIKASYVDVDVAMVCSLLRRGSGWMVSDVGDCHYRMTYEDGNRHSHRVPDCSPNTVDTTVRSIVNYLEI